MNYVSEQEMMLPFAKTFTSNGFRVFGEVPLLTKLIDAYVTDQTFTRSIAVEFKLKDWRRGLEQAKHYLLCAQEVYVAVDASVASRALKHADEFARYGIGLLAINGHAEVLLQARPSVLCDGVFERRCLEFVRSRPDKEVLM